MADVERRRASLKRRVAGVSPGGLAAVTWEAHTAQPGLAEPYTHLPALDPPPVAAGVQLAAGAPGSGMLPLA